MKKYLSTIILFLILIIGLSLVLYPTFSNWWNSFHASKAISDYAEKVATLDEDQYDALWAEAVAYNQSKPLQGGTFVLDPQLQTQYPQLLNLGNDGIMGYIEIPRTDTYLPISHGTEAETLEKSVGHVIGSSLPIGGEGTHSVLSGHSGMSDQKMFSDLNKLQEGDIFYIHVLNETLAYKVSRIDTVLPEDTSLLSIEDGKDMVTLVTCTPFGVNTHRLLVRGERTDCVMAAEEVAELEETQDTSSTWTEEYWKGIVIGIVVLIVLILILSYLESKGAKEN